jgi:hypothetical protein
LKLPAAKGKAKLSALSAELHKIEEELMSVLERSRKAGVISESDALEILEQSGTMHKELYSSYEEFMQEEAMLLKRLETHGKEWIAAREKAKRAEQKAQRVERQLKKRVRELEKQLEEARNGHTS